MKQARKAKDEDEKEALEKYQCITETVDTKVRQPQTPMERRREQQIEKAKQVPLGLTDRWGGAAGAWRKWQDAETSRERESCRMHATEATFACAEEQASKAQGSKAQESRAQENAPPSHTKDQEGTRKGAGRLPNEESRKDA